MQQLKLGWAAHNQELPEGDFSRLLGTVYIFLKITKEKRKKQPELCFTEHECKIPFNSWGQEALGCGSLLSGALTSLWWRTHQKPIRRLTTIRREQAEPQAELPVIMKRKIKEGEKNAARWFIAVILPLFWPWALLSILFSNMAPQNDIVNFHSPQLRI